MLWIDFLARHEFGVGGFGGLWIPLHLVTEARLLPDID